MSTIQSQLQKVTISSRELELNPELASKLGSSRGLAIKHSKTLSIHVFRYDLEEAISAGFLITPKRSSGKLPVIIYNRGGTRDEGLINTGTLFTQLATLASWGYVVIGSQYTGNSLGSGVDEWGGRDLEAVLGLKPIIDALDIADSDRIGMIGGSRGAVMLFRSLLQVDWVKAGCTIAGVTNLERLAESREDMNQLFSEMFEGQKNAMHERSVVKWASKLPENVPLLILHGKKDVTVSVDDAIELDKLLTEIQHLHKTILIDGMDHHLYIGMPEVDTEVRPWLAKNL